MNNSWNMSYRPVFFNSSACRSKLIRETTGEVQSFWELLKIRLEELPRRLCPAEYRGTVTCLKRSYCCQLKYHFAEQKAKDLYQWVSNTAIKIRHRQQFIASFDPFWQVFMPDWTLVWQVVKLFTFILQKPMMTHWLFKLLEVCLTNSAAFVNSFIHQHVLIGMHLSRSAALSCIAFPSHPMKFCLTALEGCVTHPTPQTPNSGCQKKNQLRQKRHCGTGYDYWQLEWCSVSEGATVKQAQALYHLKKMGRGGE